MDTFLKVIIVLFVVFFVSMAAAIYFVGLNGLIDFAIDSVPAVLGSREETDRTKESKSGSDISIMPKGCSDEAVNLDPCEYDLVCLKKKRQKIAKKAAEQNPSASLAENSGKNEGLESMQSENAETGYAELARSFIVKPTGNTVPSPALIQASFPPEEENGEEKDVAEGEKEEKKFQCPISSGRGCLPDKSPDGNDARYSFIGQPGSSVYAIYEGKIIYIGKDPDYGNIVVLIHKDGSVSAYGNSLNVADFGEKVRSGQEIARIGREEGTVPRLYLWYCVKGNCVTKIF